MRKHNALKRKEILELLKTGYRRQGIYARVFFNRSDAAETAFSISVSKKVSPLATVRNRLRRRVREIIIQESSAIEGARLLFQVLKVEKNPSHEQLSSDIRGLLKRVNEKLRIENVASTK